MVAPLGALHAESLFQEQSFRPLMADNKAFRVGDVLTVQVFENSSATTSADTGTRRRNALSADLSHGSGSVAQTAAGLGGTFDGGGRTQRTNRVLATLTVSVREVLANGDLLVGGEQTLTVNEEPQKVTLEGRVRPLDIRTATWCCPRALPTRASATWARATSPNAAAAPGGAVFWTTWGFDMAHHMKNLWSCVLGAALLAGLQIP